MIDDAIELCKRYAIESHAATVSRSILRRIPCEYASKPASPVYDSSFACVDPGDPGRLACTLMTEDELANEEEGACDNCKSHRIPALKTLQDARRQMVKTRKDIVLEGMRHVVAERLKGEK